MIDEKQALALLEEVVTAYGPDTTYDQRCKDAGMQVATGCRYVTDDDDADRPKPLCLIGVLLVEKQGANPKAFLAKIPLGVSIVSGDTLNTKSVRMLRSMAPELLQGFTAPALAILNEAQAHQDAQRTWGQALDAAKSYHVTGVVGDAVLV